MSYIQSFHAELGDLPKILVLGSIPGIASLESVQYYAHPRNAFWPVMSSFFGFSADLDYDLRLAALKAHRIALWDVLKTCERPGSLDSAIKNESIVPNDLNAFLDIHQSIELILLNGGKAGAEFKKHFRPLMARDGVIVKTMPSTSPAYAAMPFEEKQMIWHQALATVLD